MSNLLAELKDISIYFIVCILARLVFMYISYKWCNTKHRYILCIFYIMMGLGFIYNNFKYKKEDKGTFGQYVWWNDFRLVHAFNLFAIAYSLYYRKCNAIILISLFDIFIGVLGHIYNRYVLDNSN